MTTTSLRRSWIAVCVCLLFACGGPKEKPLHVVGYGPTGEAKDEKAPLRITFDRPVVDAKQVGKALSDMPLAVSPKTALRAHWQDRQTLVAVPATGWKRGTRYAVQLTGILEDRVAESFSFAFVHDPLDVVELAGIDRRWVPKRPSFTLRFDQKVRSEDVLKHCKLLANKQGESIGLTVGKNEVRVDVTLAVKEPLTQGKSYTLRCEGLTPAEGNAALAKPYEVSLEAYPKLALTSSTPSAGERATPDELTLALTFSTPVGAEQLKKHVRITPKHPALRREWLERTETRRELTATLEAATTYTLHVDGALTDKFGQKLGESRDIQFTTTDAAPWLTMESGIYAIEASAKGYPVWSRNVESFDLSCAYLDKAHLLNVLMTGLSYNAWQSSGEPTEHFKWKELNLTPKRQAVATGSRKNKWKRTELNLPERCAQPGKRGVYLVEVHQQQVEARLKQNGGIYPYRLLGNVTDLGVLLKVGPNSGLVWVANLSDGQPVVSASVTVYNTAQQKVFSGLTDARGLLTLPASEKLLPPPGKGSAADVDPYEEDSYEGYRDQRLIAIVEKGDDLAVVDGNWSDGLEAWNFGLSTDRSGGQVAVRGFIESDRGIYRPGETAHFKGLAREVPLTGEPRLPQDKQIAVRVEDGAGSELLDKKLTLSEFGGFSFDLALDPEARTGDYYVIAQLGKSAFRQTFSVEEIRPVSFEITTSANAPQNVALNSKSKVGFEARYLFGAPVVDGTVNYNVQRRRRWLSFPDYESFSFESWADGDWDPWWQPDHYSDFVAEGEAKTDAQGRFTVEVHDTSKPESASYDYLIQASVRDEADQEVTKRVAVTAHPTDLYLGVGSDSWVATSGTPFQARAVALDISGKPVAAKAELRVERVSYHCGQEEGPYAYWSCEREKAVVLRRDLSIAAEAPSSVSLNLESTGEHLLVVEGRDRKGRPVRASSSVWVVGTGDSSWASSDSARMSLIPNKRSFKPGETAILVPEADTQGGTMLVTTERGGVVEARLVQGGGTAAIEVPLREAHAPNVFVSVALVRGRRGEQDGQRPELKMGMVNLPVSFGQRALNVEITTEGEVYQPGQLIQGKVRVRTQDGAPVRAEVALSAADEGVLQLIAYQTPNPMESIYAAFGLGIQNASSWTRVAKLNGMPEDASEEGADAPGSDGDDVRSRFVASAFWAPALVTDAQGEASFSFEAPDNLTAFRLMAAVADTGARFGSADRRVRVRKDLLITPVVPRFLMAEDQIELGAVVHNYTDHNGEVETTFDLTGVTPRKKSVKTKVPANGKAVVRVPVKVSAHEQARFQVAAQLLGSDGAVLGKDALLLNLPIERPVVKDAHTLFSGRGTEHKALLAYQRNLDLKVSRLEVMADRTGLADLAPSLRYLIHYPYGCLEQTMSGLMPLLKVRDLAKSLEMPELLGEKLETYIRLGVAKVARHQHPDGHFSLWPDSQTYPHLTVYAMWGLNEAKQAGVRVDKRALALGVDALRGWTNDAERTLAPGDETGTMAMAAYVLSQLGAGDRALEARLFSARKALPVYGKAFLARAMSSNKASAGDVKLLLEEISATVQVSDGVASVKETLPLHPHYFSSESRSMALVVQALLELSPGSELIAPLVMGLKQRRNGGRWGSTQENVYGLLALADFARKQANGKSKMEIRLGQKVLAARTLTGGDMARVALPLAELSAGEELRVSASEPLFVTAVVHEVRPEKVASELANGLTVKREYLDFKSGKPLTSIKVGQLMNVRVSLSSPKNRSYVAISDPLPAGFESVNAKLASERDVSDEDRYGWFWDYRALRDERTDWFVDSLEAGTRELTYVLRATHAGTFTVPPARAHEMYDESVMGHGKSDVLTVTR